MPKYRKVDAELMDNPPKPKPRGRPISPEQQALINRIKKVGPKVVPKAIDALALSDKSHTMVLVDIRETKSVKASDIFLQVKPGKDFELMFDLVLNHCSRKSAWFRDFVTGIAPARWYSSASRTVTATPTARCSRSGTTSSTARRPHRAASRPRRNPPRSTPPGTGP